MNVISSIMAFIGAYYNSRTLIGHLISRLYFIKYKSQLNHDHHFEASDANHLHEVIFKNRDIFSSYKLECCQFTNAICKACCRKKMKTHEEILS